MTNDTLKLIKDIAEVFGTTRPELSEEQMYRLEAKLDQFFDDAFLQGYDKGVQDTADEVANGNHGKRY